MMIPISVTTRGEHKTNRSIAFEEAKHYVQHAAPSFNIEVIEEPTDFNFEFTGEASVRDVFVLKQYRDIDCHVIGANENLE